MAAPSSTPPPSFSFIPLAGPSNMPRASASGPSPGSGTGRRAKRHAAEANQRLAAAVQQLDAEAAARAAGGIGGAYASTSTSSSPTAPIPPRPGRQEYSFNSKEVIQLSHVRSSARRMPDLAHVDALENRIRIPKSRWRGAGAYASSDDEDDANRVANIDEQHTDPTVQQRRRPPKAPEPNTVPDARHASMFLAYIHEHDTSSTDISLCNEVDYEPAPSWDFAYCDSYVPSREVAAIDAKRAQPGSGWCQRSTYDGWEDKQVEDLQGTRRGCSCGEDGGECRPETCECAKLHLFVDQTWDQPDLGLQGPSMAYGEDGRLKPECLGFNALSIFECTDACGCSEDCPNRVAQKGRKVALEIFKTQKCGWGLRARNFIPAGTFITAYGGELCTNDEADQRGKVYERTVGTTYVPDLEHYWHEDVATKSMAMRAFPDMPQETEEQREAVMKLWEKTDEGRQSYLSVDAGLYGNIARFLNHSCSPNLNQEYVWLSSDLDFARPRACFFTNRDVAAGEELRFSYQETPDAEEAERIKGRLEDMRRSTLVEGKVIYQRCHCGEAGCVGIMFDEAQTEGAAQYAAAKQEAAESESKAALESRAGVRSESASGTGSGIAGSSCGASGSGGASSRDTSAGVVEMQVKMEGEEDAKMRDADEDGDSAESGPIRPARRHSWMRPAGEEDWWIDMTSED